MMVKINELIDFEEIKDVIDIDSDVNTTEDKEKIVKDYIISERLKEFFISFAENISKPKHKSIQIIGNYGSGKSHLLAWLVSLLENPELVEFINNEDVKNKFRKSLKRDIAVVQFELQPGEAALSEFFFDRIEEQLKLKYNINISNIETSKTVDFKKYIGDILNLIKKNNPKMALVVIIDEISDFLKQKRREYINRDMQFLRIMGQISQNMDFLFIGSMQELVFSSAKYIDEAESFGRVSERFEIFTLSREDINKVISQRVIKKDDKQRERINELLSDYKKEFSIVNADPESFIDLFPIHPYVLQLFNEFEYFEKRGVIQFTIEQVRKILDNDFPKFITFNSIFDEIDSRHTIRNLDKVRPIIDVIKTLGPKIDLLEKRFQDEALKLVKALAILKLYGKTPNNGATVEELANELLIRSKNKLKNTDRILIILNKLREVTSGQFIGKTDEDYFYITLEGGIDHEEVINRKIKNLPEGAEDDELLKILKYGELIDAENAEMYIRTFQDTCSWPDKKSFRLGHFIFNDGSSMVKKGDSDFNIIILSIYQEESKFSSSENTAILRIKYNQSISEMIEQLDIRYIKRIEKEKIDFIDFLKRLAAIKLLVNENYAKTVMKKKYIETKRDCTKILIKVLINSNIEIDGKKKKIKSVLTKEPDNIDEFFHYLKEKLFSEYFNSKYPKYPKFLNQLSYNNIKGEVENTINELLSKNERDLFSNVKNMLSSLDLIDLDGNIDTTNSNFAKFFLMRLKENVGKNVKIEELIKIISAEPIGLNVEIAQLILLVLTYTGEINLKKKGGGTITSSELPEIFRSGLSAYNSIPYATLETEFPIESIIKLFRALNVFGNTNLSPGLIRNSKERTKAVQKFRAKILKIKEMYNSVGRNIQEISSLPDSIIDNDEINNKMEKLDDIPVDEFLKVKMVNDFKKVAYSDEDIAKIEENLAFLVKIDGFFEDYNEFIHKDYVYMKNSIKWMENYPDFFLDEDKKSLIKIDGECKPFLFNFSNLLDREQRRELKGKLQQYKRKYISLYYYKHKQTVGEEINWKLLKEINGSSELQKLRDMRVIKCINSSELNRLDDKIISLSRSKCTKLLEDHLKKNNLCTWCRFPETIKDISNIDNEIEKMVNKINTMSDKWTKIILNEIETYSDNIENLSKSEKNIINKIQSEKKLQEEITQDTINALNNLFSELHVVEISSKKMLNFIFSGSNVLDFKNFSKKLDEYKIKILQNYEKRNIRIKKKIE